MCIYTQVDMYVHILYIYIYIYVCVCVYACLYMYICTASEAPGPAVRWSCSHRSGAGSWSSLSCQREHGKVGPLYGPHVERHVHPKNGRTIHNIDCSLQGAHGRVDLV